MLYAINIQQALGSIFREKLLVLPLRSIKDWVTERLACASVCGRCRGDRRLSREKNTPSVNMQTNNVGEHVHELGLQTIRVRSMMLMSSLITRQNGKRKRSERASD